MSYSTRLRVPALLALCLAAQAAGAESVSNVAGGRYFLGAGSSAYVSPSAPADFLERLKQLCDTQQPLYAHGAAAPAKCARYGGAEQNGERAVALSVVGGKAAARRPAVYSTEPFAPDAWRLRPALAEEAARVAQLLSGHTLAPAFQSVVNQRSPEIARRLSGAPVQVVDAKDGSYTLYLAPWAESEDENLTKNTETLVLRAKGSRFNVIGNLTGDVVDFVDLDGDGMVEVQVSRGCGGRCDAVYSFKSGTMQPVLELK